MQFFVRRIKLMAKKLHSVQQVFLRVNWVKEGEKVKKSEIGKNLTHKSKSGHYSNT